MQVQKLLRKLVNVNGIRVVGVEFEGERNIILDVVPHKRLRRIDTATGKKCKGYDRGSGKPSLWRSLDIGPFRVYLRYRAERIVCPDGEIRTEALPWADPRSRFTRDFETQVAILAKGCSTSMVARLMGIDWETVGIIVRRYVERHGRTPEQRFSDLRRIGVDETSYRKGHRYMTIVVDHDSGFVIWVHLGHGKKIFAKFLEQLTEEQRDSIELVSGDGARWIDECMREYLPKASRCVDPFHVVSWAADALDELRKEAWNEARKEEEAGKKRGRGRPRKGEEKKGSKASEIKGSRYSLWKNPDKLTEDQSARLEFIAKSNPRLYRGYLLKEKLRLIFHMKDADAVEAELDEWLSWAQRCRIIQFRELRKKIKRHKESILATLRHGLSNARIEAINNKIKLSIRMAYGFRNEENMLAMIMFRCSDIHVEPLKPAV